MGAVGEEGEFGHTVKLWENMVHGGPVKFPGGPRGPKETTPGGIIWV